VRAFPLAPVPSLSDALAVPQAAFDQDGVFTRSQARHEGWGDRRQRHLVRAGLWVPVAGSVLRHHDIDLGPWQAARTVQLTSELVPSHHTAALVWGLLVPTELHGIGRSYRVPLPVRHHRLPLEESDLVTVRGVTLTTPARTLCDLMCSLGEDDGVAMLTDAFRRGLLSAADASAAAVRAQGRHGVGLARHLAQTCRREPHSWLEWRFHGLCDALGPGWEFNVDIYDDEGFVGCADALQVPSGTVVELDGQRFHGADRFQADRTRDQRLAALGYVVLRVTWDDVEHRPMDVTERIRRTIAVRATTNPLPAHRRLPASAGTPPAA
jgi:hypothetical protein